MRTPAPQAATHYSVGMKNRLITVGWREWVQLPKLGSEWIKAKVDTGARSSSLHAFDLELFERDEVSWVRFATHASPDAAHVEAPLLEHRSVKSSSGTSEVRPVIRTTLSLAGTVREIDLTLTNRDEMGFGMLLGREALRGGFEVNPGRSFATGQPDAKGKREPFRIANARIPAGHKQRLDLPIAALVTGAQVSLPVMVLHGRDEGPTVWLDAAIHGDEIGGVEIIRRVLEKLDPDTIRGTLLVVPVVNVHGFVNGERYLPDRRDLNRSFPGGNTGSLARRIAHLLLTEVVERCSVGIDLHTGSDGRSNLPQIRADLDDPETLELARTFGAPLMVNAKPRDSSLRGSATAAGKKILVFEGGEAWRFDPHAVEVGYEGVMRVLQSLGLISEIVPPAPTLIRADKSRWVRAARSGVLQLNCKLGDIVKKGQVLGRIHDSFGERLSSCKSPSGGIVLGMRLEPLVNRGDALFHVATTTEESP